MPIPSPVDPPSGEPPLLERLSSQLLPELKKYLGIHRAEINGMLDDGRELAGEAACRRAAKVYDGLLSALFHAARIAMMRQENWTPVSLAAVGSYGRGALAPFSDLDVRLLCERDERGAGPIAEVLLYPLWDAGLSIGHQVVTIDQMIELSRSDLPTATSLLDWRPIAGEASFDAQLLERAFQGVFGPAGIASFLQQLQVAADERHERFGGSVFLLEPDVKNGEGGIRDLDIAHWAARARWRVEDLAHLVRVGVLVRREWNEIAQARSFLYLVRNLLHKSAGRRADRLGFEQQEQLADALGYGGTGPGVERFMSDYYRHARTIARAREMILTRAEPPPRRPPRATAIGRGLKITRDAVSLVDPGALRRDPALALRLYDEAVRRGLPVYAFARDAVARAASSSDFCRKLRDSREAAELFVRLVCVVQETKLKHGSVIYELHDVGLLVAMVPEFEPVVGRVHHDIYHVYTVDVHSVAAVDQLRALCRGDLAADHPLACRLAAELSRPRVLFFATLLHDIGKDLGGKKHAERGAELAKAILERLRFDPGDIAEVQHHIVKHLRMYHVATRRDIDDPRTLEEFCTEVHGVEGLRELYLLTLSDVTTTSPGSMTSWKRRMLDELYVAAERFLSEGRRRDATLLVELAKKRVAALWIDGADDPFIVHFLSAVPQRYLYANEPEWIVAQARFAKDVLDETASVTVLDVDEPYVELGVIADDRPGLLALITAAFSHAKLKVMGAQIYSWTGQDGRTRSLDMFWVRSGQRSDEVVDRVPGIERELRRLSRGEISPEELVLARPQSPRWSLRPTPPIATKVNVDNRSATDHTIIEVITKDRRDLLFWLSATLQKLGLSIQLAKVNTEGERVADVFYVVDACGGKIRDAARLTELKERISSIIAQIQAGG